MWFQIVKGVNYIMVSNMPCSNFNWDHYSTGAAAATSGTRASSGRDSLVSLVSSTHWYRLFARLKLKLKLNEEACST